MKKDRNWSEPSGGQEGELMQQFPNGTTCFTSWTRVVEPCLILKGLRKGHHALFRSQSDHHLITKVINEVIILFIS